MKKIITGIFFAFAGTALGVGATTIPIIDVSNIVQCPLHASTSTAPIDDAYIVNTYNTPSGNLDAGFFDVATGQIGIGTASSTVPLPANVIGHQAYTQCLDDMGKPISRVQITDADYQQFISYHDPNVKDSWRPRSTSLQPLIQL